MLKDTTRTRKTIDQILARDWNMENQSYFPYVLGQYGYPEQIRSQILHLTDPATKRREYPEVSYGAVQGVVPPGAGGGAAPRTCRTARRATGPRWALMLPYRRVIHHAGSRPGPCRPRTGPLARPSRT